MTATTPSFPSRLPQVGTTIFSTMSALAQQHQAVNLGQGFPDFGCDPRLLHAVTNAMHAGHNQYAPMPGIAALRQALWGYPAMTLAIIARIHWHALQLWLKRVRFHRKPEAPASIVTR